MGPIREGQRRRMAATATLSLACLAMMRPALAIEAQTRERTPAVANVTGVVVDGESRRAIAGAELRLGDRTALSDQHGRFRFQAVEVGTVELRTSMLGYEPRHDPIVLPDHQSVAVVIPLARRPVDVAPIRVEVRSSALMRRGFFERRESGYAGHFFTRADLVERDARNLTGLLGSLPGVRRMPAGIEGDRIVFERATTIAGGGLCEPALFLDGVKSQMRLYDLILDPSHVEGLEVYTGATIPGRYNDPCGAVLVWTRVP